MHAAASANVKGTNSYYREIASSNTSCLEAHVGIYILLMKGIFDAYLLWPFDKKFIFELVARVYTHHYTVSISILI